LQRFIVHLSYLTVLAVLAFMFAQDQINAGCAFAFHYCSVTLAHCTFLMQSGFALAGQYLWIFLAAILVYFGKIIVEVHFNKTTQIYQAGAAPPTTERSEKMVDGSYHQGWARLRALSPSQIHTPRPGPIFGHFLSNRGLQGSTSSGTAQANSTTLAAAQQATAAHATAREQFMTPSPRVLYTPSIDGSSTLISDSFSSDILAERAPTSFETLKRMGMLDSDGTPTKKWKELQQTKRLGASWRDKPTYDDIIKDASAAQKKKKRGGEVMKVLEAGVPLDEKAFSDLELMREETHLEDRVQMEEVSQNGGKLLGRLREVGYDIE
jgi:hypothetical protein